MKQFKTALLYLARRQFEDTSTKHFTQLAVLGLIYYMIPYVTLACHDSLHFGIILTSRIIAGGLCLGVLLFQTTFSNFARKHYFPLYWYSTLLYAISCAPFFALLLSDIHAAWLANAVLSLIALAILSDDYKTYAIMLLLGTTLGYFAYLLFKTHAQVITNIHLAIYSLSFTLIFSLLILYYRVKTNGRIASYKSIYHDFDKMVEESVKSKMIEIQCSIESKVNFFNNVHHDIRMYTQGVASVACELERGWNTFTDEQKYHYMSIVSESAQNLVNISSDLLDWSKIESGKMELSLQPFNIVEIAEAAIKDLQSFSFFRKMPIILKSEIELLYVIADRYKISQVLRNLLSNAIKYAEHGYVTVRILQELDDITRKPWASVAVIDQGSGIKNTDTEEIFSPFYQGREAPYFASTGLGLAICREIIKMHKGKILARNNEIKGATFIFMLPVQEEIINSFTNSNNKISLEIKTVLLIDDEYIGVESGKLMLESMGLNVLTASSFQEGYKIMLQSNIDIIFFDIISNEDCLNFINKINSSFQYKHILFIAATGHPLTTEIQNAISYNIYKPYNRDDVTKALQYISTKYSPH